MVIERFSRALPVAYFLLRAVWLAPSTLYDAIRKPRVPNRLPAGGSLPTYWLSHQVALVNFPARVTEKYRRQLAVPGRLPTCPMIWPDWIGWPSLTSALPR